MRPATISPLSHRRMLLLSPPSNLHFLKHIMTEAHFDALCGKSLSMKTIWLENMKYDYKCEWY